MRVKLKAKLIQQAWLKGPDAKFKLLARCVLASHGVGFLDCSAVYMYYIEEIEYSRCIGSSHMLKSTERCSSYTAAVIEE